MYLECDSYRFHVHIVVVHNMYCSKVGAKLKKHSLKERVIVKRKTTKDLVKEYVGKCSFTVPA